MTDETPARPRHDLSVPQHWLNIGPARGAEEYDLEQHTSFAAIFDAIERMRVVPFDFRSTGQLLGSVAAILPLVELEGHLPKWLEFFASLFSVFR